MLILSGWGSVLWVVLELVWALCSGRCLPKYITNTASEGIDNLIKKVKGVPFGFNSLKHYGIRSLLYTGKVNWGLLSTIAIS